MRRNLSKCFNYNYLVNNCISLEYRLDLTSVCLQGKDRNKSDKAIEFSEKSFNGWEPVWSASFHAVTRSDAVRSERAVPKNRQPHTFSGAGSPFRVGGELLSHGLPQYHRRGGA